MPFRHLLRSSLAPTLAALALVSLACDTSNSAAERDQGPADAERPNVLFIVWDTVRADRLSLHDYARPTTPRLKAFAEAAMVFELAISPGTWTVPSHASMFTGLPVSAHGAHFKHKWLDDEFETLAERFRDAGWQTFAFSANPFVSSTTNLLQGFETVQHPYDDTWREAVRRHVDAKAIAEDRSTILSPARPRNKNAEQEADNHFKESGPIAGFALLDWLDQREDERPFFAFLNYMEAHTPRIPSRRARDAVMDPDRIALSLRTDQNSHALHAWAAGLVEYSDEELAAISQVYDAALVDLDHATGELLDSLEARGILDETIVVLTSDHGENLGDHQLFGHRFCAYNSLIHVPMLIRYPRRLAPQRVSGAVSTLDLFSTVQQLAGLPLPSGHSMSRDLSAATPGDRGVTPVFSQLLHPTRRALHSIQAKYGQFDWTPFLHRFETVISGDDKLIRSSNGSSELYDLSTDAGEARNRLPAERERAAQLGAVIDEWLRSYPHHISRSGSPTEISPRTARQLEALGYTVEETSVPQEKEKPHAD